MKQLTDTKDIPGARLCVIVLLSRHDVKRIGQDHWQIVS